VSELAECGLAVVIEELRPAIAAQQQVTRKTGGETDRIDQKFAR